MTRKLGLISLSAALCLSFAACGDDGGGEDEAGDTTDSTTGDGDTTTGDGDTTTGDGDTTDSTTGDGDTTDSTTGDGDTTDSTDSTTGDGDTTDTTTTAGDTTDTGGTDTGGGDLCDTQYESCDALQAAFAEETLNVRSCTEAAECGQVLQGTSCGCTRNWVARLDADTTCFYALIDQAQSLQCDLGLNSTCDCPEADGYDCVEGICVWNYI